MTAGILNSITPVLGAAEAGSSGIGFNFIILILLFAGMWFLIIAPQRKKQKKHDGMVKGLKAGDAVLTNGGIYGTVLSVKDDRFVIKVGENTKLEVAKNYIATVLPTANEENVKKTEEKTKKLEKFAAKT